MRWEASVLVCWLVLISVWKLFYTRTTVTIQSWAKIPYFMWYGFLIWCVYRLGLS